MTANSRNLLLIFLLAALSALLLAITAGARAADSLDTIIIDAGYDKQTRIAVVPFSQGPEFDGLQPLSEIIEFDLAYSNLNEKRIERAWIDLIIEGPNMNQIVLRDLTFSRRPRAEL